MIKVWDFPTRIFHWTLVIAMAVCLYTSYNFSDYYELGFLGGRSAMEIHQYSGLFILGLMLFRILWGFIGATTSRFTNFIKGPKAIASYLAEGKTATEGHNPLGALMVIAMLAMIFTQVVTGLFLEDNSYMYQNAPFASIVEGDTRANLKLIHYYGRNILIGLIGLHIVAVFVYLFGAKMNLIRPMVTGKRELQAAHTESPESIKKDRPFAGILIMLIILAAVFKFL